MDRKESYHGGVAQAVQHTVAGRRLELVGIAVDIKEATNATVLPKGGHASPGLIHSTARMADVVLPDNV